MSSNSKRWYDHDPLLLKAINILKDYKAELKEQAEIFLSSIEKQVSKEAVDKFYEMVKPFNGGSRWYDDDPVISRTVELLRVIPANTQKEVARQFIDALRENGINID